MYWNHYLTPRFRGIKQKKLHWISHFPLGRISLHLWDFTFYTKGTSPSFLLRFKEPAKQARKVSSRENLPFFISDYCLIKYFRIFLNMAHYFFKLWNIHTILYCQKIRKPRQKFMLQLQRERPKYIYFFFKSYCCLSTHMRINSS